MGGGGGKGKKNRYGLVECCALPGYLWDNEYILWHHRCKWPLPQVLLSTFTTHNETLNVWTDETEIDSSAALVAMQGIVL
uniref:Uncharacterized protein n=1 Tax=Arundo donax TaxID=35708 RepID=A0A0A9FW88_ARUDO